MRRSNDKIVDNETLFQSLYPQYLDILEDLARRYDCVEAQSYENLVNFQTNLTSPKHGWYDYKQGYSEMLVKIIIDECKPSVDSFILDPFCGVGTTNLVAQSLGFKSIGTDINPMAILAAKVKTHFYTTDEIELIDSQITNFKLPSKKDVINGGRVILTSFTKDVLNTLLQIKYFIEHIDNIYVQMFFRLAFISIIDVCSQKVKDGNGLKFKKNYRPVENVVDVFLNKSKRMLSDIHISNHNIECNCILGSMLDPKIAEEVKKNPIELCVFSPPYANCFDYCEVYKLELWLGGYVKSYSDFKIYRDMALRSHVNSKFSHEFSEIIPEVDIIASLVSTFNLWNKNIPDMLRGYFDDMKILLKNVFHVLSKNSKCYIVVANSAYKGILVPTDLILAYIAESLGYKCEKIHIARKIRSSSQQMKELYEEYDNLMRESIVELSKTS